MSELAWIASNSISALLRSPVARPCNRIMGAGFSSHYHVGQPGTSPALLAEHITGPPTRGLDARGGRGSYRFLPCCSDTLFTF